jgi:excisionase family DNA binding protein
MTSNHSTTEQPQSHDSAEKLNQKSAVIVAKTEPETFYTVAQVAEYLSVSERTVRRWIHDGKLIAHHFGRAVRIAGSSFEAFRTASSASPQTDSPISSEVPSPPGLRTVVGRKVQRSRKRTEGV